LLNGQDVTHQDRRIFTFFLSGTCAWLWRDKIPVHFSLAIAAATVALIASQFPPFFQILTPVAACYLVLWAGFNHPVRSAAWCDKTDLSYGVYLFAFPIQQAVAYAGTASPMMLFAITAPVVLGIAFLSWTFVEKPFLKLKSVDFSDYDPAHAIKSKEAVPITSNAKTSW